MMTYTIKGADKKTGVERTTIIHAVNQKTAEETASQQGMFVESITSKPYHSTDYSAPSSIAGSPGHSTATPTRSELYLRDILWWINFWSKLALFLIVTPIVVYVAIAVLGILLKR